LRREGKRTGQPEKSPIREQRPTSAQMAAPDVADPVSVSNLSLHELFEQQARHLLDSVDLDEEQKQSILVAMACPCCGAGGMSFSVKLQNRSPDRAQRNPGRSRPILKR
jgi:hypothetical protein